MTLKLTAQQLRDVSYALEGLTRIRKDLGVEVGVHVPVALGWDGGGDTMEARWDPSINEYIIDDFTR